MSVDTKPAKDRTQIIEDARLLCEEARASCQHARTIREQAARTRAENKLARRQAEEICLEVGMKVWLLQTVRQVIQERKQARKPPLKRRKGQRPTIPIPLVSPDEPVWEQFHRLSPQTACVQ